MRHSDFKQILSVRSKFQNNIVALEGDASLLLARWICRSAKNHGKRTPVLIDAQSVLGALAKGRSSSGSWKVTFDEWLRISSRPTLPSSRFTLLVRTIRRMRVHVARRSADLSLSRFTDMFWRVLLWTFCFARPLSPSSVWLNWFPLVCGASTILLGRGWRRECPIIAIAGPAYFLFAIFWLIEVSHGAWDLLSIIFICCFLAFRWLFMSCCFSPQLASRLLALRARIEQRYDT